MSPTFAVYFQCKMREPNFPATSVPTDTELHGWLLGAIKRNAYTDAVDT